MKRIIGLLLAILMIAPFLFACGGDPDESSNDNTPDNIESTNDDDESADDSEETVNNSTSDLPDITWDGQVFNVLGNLSPTYKQFENFEIVYDEENLGEAVNDAIFKRNTLIETKYDVKITQYLANSITDSLRTTSVTGDHLYDLTFQSLDSIASNALEGFFFDLNSIKYIDFTKDYWNAQVNDEISIADRLYFTTSDFALRDKSRTRILFYNPKLAEANGIPDLFPIVDEGKWTIDLMGEYADVVDADLTGEGTRNINDDCYGFGVDSTYAFASLIYGMDNMIVSRNEDNKLTLTMNTEHMINSIDKALKFYANTNITHQSRDDGTPYSQAWYAGRILFVGVFTHSLRTSSERCEFDFNVIPWPKYDETQDQYRAAATTSCMLFAIPTSCVNSEFSGFMIEALSDVSTETSLHAYYDIACKTRYSYNEKNGEMLDIIFDGIRYDCGMIYPMGGLFDIIASSIPSSGQNFFANLYKRKENSAINKIEELEETLRNLPY